MIDTHYHEQFSPPEMMKVYLCIIPLGRIGTPEEVASLICLLACEAASFLAGETIEIKAGC